MRKYVILTALMVAYSAAAQTIQDQATVTNVEKVIGVQQVCQNVQAGTQTQERGISGAIVGGLAGGILGNQVGKGSGKTAATAGGAIVGAIVGDRVQNNGSSNQPQMVQQCTNQQMVTETIISYRYGNMVNQARVRGDSSVRIGDRLIVDVTVTPRF